MYTFPRWSNVLWAEPLKLAFACVKRGTEEEHELKACGRHLVETVERAIATADKEAEIAFRITCEKFGKYSTGYLVDLTHT
jgi:hypothetical protein